MPNSVVSTEGRRPEWRDLFSTISYLLWREGFSAPRGVPTHYGKRRRVAISPCLSLLETGSRSADDEASTDANGSFSRRGDASLRSARCLLVRRTPCPRRRRPS